MSTKLRKLRIAFSVVCGIVCLLLAALWVRSYWWSDGISIPISTAKRFSIRSAEGFVVLHFPKNRSRMNVFSSLNLVEIELLMSQRDSLGRPLVTKSPPKIGFHDGRFECPHGFFLILGILLTAVCGISPTFRFSLRTLLIATTLVAVLLGAIVYAMR